MRTCRYCGQERKVPDEIGPKGRTCFDCQIERRRASQREYARRLGRDAEYRAQRAALAREWRATHVETNRETQQRYRERVRADPERYAQRLADGRINYRLRRERQGGTVRQLKPETYAQRMGRRIYGMYAGVLPVDPLARKLEEWLPPMDERQSVPHPAAGLEALASLSGVSARRLFAVLHGEQQRVSLDVADRVLTAIGDHLSLTYPEELT